MDTHIHAPTDVFAIAKTEHLHSMLLCWRPVKRKYHPENLETDYWVIISKDKIFNKTRNIWAQKTLVKRLTKTVKYVTERDRCLYEPCVCQHQSVWKTLTMLISVQQPHQQSCQTEARQSQVHCFLANHRWTCEPATQPTSVHCSLCTAKFQKN